MLPVKVASKSLYETSAVSLFAHPATPVLLAACSNNVTVAVTLARSFCIFSPQFLRKRETAYSLASTVAWLQYSPKIMHAQEVTQEVLALQEHASGEKKLN